MKRFFCILFSLLFICSTYAYAEGELTVDNKNLLEFDSDDTGYFYAKIENTGDSAIGVGYGKLVGFSANDDILLSENYVSTYPSGIILQPGEYVYAKTFIWESALEDNDVIDYRFSVEVDEYGSEVYRIPCEVTFDLNGVDSFDNYIYVTFTNDGESILYNSFISVALYDANESLLFVEGNYYETLGVHPGSTVTVKLYVDNDLMKHYKAHSLVPTSADASVFVISDD